MKQITFAAILWAATSVCFAQTTQTWYYKEMHGDEVDEKRAKYSYTVTKHEDGTETLTWRDLKRNTVVDAYHGKEPVDVWVSHWGGKDHVKDYNFTLVYAKRDCAQGANPTALSNQSAPVRDYFFDDPAQDYVAPTIASGEKNIMIFLQRNLQYPAHARRMGIQGTVIMNMTITREGKIEDIVVTDGIDIIMDKEAVRVIRLLKLATPPTLKGQPIDACVKFPIKYKLAN